MSGSSSPVPSSELLEGLTFDDVLLVPARSDLLPREVDVRTRFSRNVDLRIPVSSAAMDTVSERKLAVALAREGGIAIIHRNLSIERQVDEVSRVKRSANGVIRDPVTLSPSATMGEAREVMARHEISGLPIVEGQTVVGILTRRDCRYKSPDSTPVAEVMTSRGLVTAPPGTSFDEARDLLFRNKIEKLIIAEPDGRLAGLITMRDLDMLEEYPNSASDERGRLRVGAAVGVHDYERAAGLVAADVDVLVVDTAHGHSKNVLETVERLKADHAVDVVAGNVATPEAARELARAGADGVKVGIGPGSICTTRVVAGVGVPQFTAIQTIARELADTDVPVIADGGIRFSGDGCKALGAGASCLMVGSLLAGVEESPGETILYKGRTFKAVRGMGSLGAMMEGGKERYRQSEVTEADKLVPEGIEGMVPYKGHLSSFVYQFVGGIRAGMGYCGAPSIPELWRRARFVRVSAAGQRESHPHDVTITKESPNYFQE